MNHIIPGILLSICILTLTAVMCKLWERVQKVEANIVTILTAYATLMKIIKIYDKRIWALFNAMQGTGISPEAHEVLFRQFDDFIWELREMKRATENRCQNNKGEQQ